MLRGDKDDNKNRKGKQKKEKMAGRGMKPIITATPFTNSRLDDQVELINQIERLTESKG